MTSHGAYKILLMGLVRDTQSLKILIYYCILEFSSGSFCLKLLPNILDLSYTKINAEN